MPVASIYQNINNGKYEPMNAYDKKSPWAHHNEKQLLKELFKKDLLASLNLTKHPKADLLFEKAWDMGHSAGYAEVVSIAQDLAELLS